MFRTKNEDGYEELRTKMKIFIKRKQKDSRNFRFVKISHPEIQGELVVDPETTE